MYRNNEHYADPTFAEAYANIRRQMKTAADSDWIYIASPYRGDVKRNTENAKKYAAFAVRQGKLPLCPHIYFTQFLNDDAEDERSILTTRPIPPAVSCATRLTLCGYINFRISTRTTATAKRLRRSRL